MEWKNLQHSFVDALEKNNNDVSACLAKSEGTLPKSIGLKIYQNAYFYRMRETLSEEFSQTFHFLPEKKKDLFVKEFLKKYPSTSHKMDDFSAPFPDFLAGKKWPKELSFLPDLAKLEWAMTAASYGRVIPVEGLDRIPVATEAEWMESRFVFDPGLFLFVSEWPLAELFEGQQGKKGEHFFAVYRKKEEAVFREMKKNEFELITALHLGLSLGAVLDGQRELVLAPAVFDGWIQSGLLWAIQWPKREVLN